jgi:hypothetical protein
MNKTANTIHIYWLAAAVVIGFFTIGFPYWQIPYPEIIDRTYEFYRKAGFRRDLIISEAGIRGTLDFLSETVPEAKKTVPGQFFDDRFVRQLNSGK